MTQRDPFMSAPPAPPSRIALRPPPPERGPSSETRPDLPAVCPPLPARLSEPPFEEGERVTHISRPPEVEHTRDRFLLLRLDGAEGGELVSLSPGVTSVGRETDNALRIDEAGVSRHHAQLVWHDGTHVLVDLESRNGTYLRGRRVQNTVLADGDLIQFGPHAHFRYTVTDALHEKLLRQLYESSTCDGLTGAYNRRHFEARLQAELSFSKRHGTDLAIVMLDIDHFKRMNDQHGHPAGDAVIRHLATLARRQIRAEDLLARYGGEEFVLLLRGTDVRGAARVAERIRATLEVLPARWEGKMLAVSVSAGCAALLEPGMQARDLVKRADERLYLAKQGGRNRVVGAAVA